MHEHFLPFRPNYHPWPSSLPVPRAFLQFDGVDSAFYCWLNGQLVGFSKDSRLPAEFDVTDMIVCGSNLLAVQVTGRSRKDEDGARL